MINFLFKKERLYLFGLIFIISLAWMLKTLYFVHELELSPHKKFLLVSSIGFSLCIISILVSKLSKAKVFLVFIIYLLSTLLMYADVVYERYYDAILHIELMGQANQVGEVFGAVVSLLFKSDYIYWIDLPFIAFALVFFYKKSSGRKSILEASTIFFVGAALILLTAFLPLKNTFSDQYKVSLVGIYPAHLFDLYESIFPDSSASASVSNQASLKELQSYFKENQELQKKSAYFGKYKGKNVVIIQAESLNNFPIGLKVNGQEITPNLNKLLKTSNYYPNTFLQIGRGNTSDAEFVTNNSIYPIAPKGIYKGFPGNDYLSLANVLNKEGYSTSASHGNAPEFWNRQQAYKKQGYKVFYHSNHPRIKKDELIGLGISDESIFKQMVGIYKDEKQPFYNFTISLTNHRPFEMPKKYQYLNLPKQFDNTPTGNYLQGVHYFDKSLGIFIKEMKKANLWDNTIFAVYGDHYGPVPNDAKEIKKLLNIDFSEKTRFKIPLIIHLPGQDKGEINETVASQMDIYPTITTLLGIERPLVQFGKPLTEKRDGFVGFAYETTRYTFYSQKVDYIASPDGKFESGKCIDNHTNKQVKVQACSEGYNKLFKDIEISKNLLDNNEITHVYGGF